jgi:nitrate/nitrite transporter NarK
MKGAEKRLTMVLLCFSGSIIYWLPFLSEIFYVPMQDAFGFSKTQIGILLSTFGFVSLITYIPGGWLADQVAPRKLISAALLITSAGGFVFSTFPSFEICVLLHGLWGVTTGCIFWSALIKATRNWASEKEQGRAFGILEGGRNSVDMVIATIMLFVFAFRGASDAALSEQIISYALAALILALIVWMVMEDDTALRKDKREVQPTLTAAGIRLVLRLPIVWLMAIIIMAAYSGYWGVVYFTPYATETFALGSVLGGAVGTAKLWIAALAAVIGGFIADRIGPAKAVLGAFILMTSGFLIFALLPGKPSLLPLLLINVAVISSAVYALRGIYFSLLEQGGIPIAVTGTATGVISLIGYTPDIFVPTLGGMILDANPGAGGYQDFFLFITALSFIGLVAAFIVYRKVQCKPDAVQESDSHAI